MGVGGAVSRDLKREGELFETFANQVFLTSDYCRALLQLGSLGEEKVWKEISLNF